MWRCLPRQELVAVTKHLEKLVRGCERAAADHNLEVGFARSGLFLPCSLSLPFCG